MLNLVTQYDIDIQGYSGSPPEPEWGYNGYRMINSNKFAWCLLNCEGAANLAWCGLYAIDGDITQDQAVQRKIDNHGRYGTAYEDWRDVNTLSHANFLTPTQGGNLLTLANRSDVNSYFFGGIQQTAASLYQYMTDLYGTHNGFTYDATYGSDLAITSMVNNATYTIPYEYAPDYATWNPTPAATFTGITHQIPADITNDTMARAFLIFGQPQTPTELQFDVYVNGAQDPNVAVKWQVVSMDDSFSLQLVNPIVWAIPNPTSQTISPVHEEDGIMVPNETAPTMRKYANTWPGSYEKPYLTEFNTDTEQMSTVEKIFYYGVDGIANKMIYLMRFNYSQFAEGHSIMTWGDLYEVRVPRNVTSAEDIEVRLIEDSAKQPLFNTSIEIHLGAAPEDIPDDDEDYPDGEDYDGDPGGSYDPDTVIPDFGDYETDGFTGKAILTRTYAMDAAVLQNVGSKLWSQSYLDVFKIQNNPIENVISVKWFPFALSGTSTDIKVGNVSFGINADKLDTLYKFDVGSCKVQPKYNSFLDMSPYTTVKLHLPYCGILQLDATEIYKRTISIRYVVDLVSGDCMAFVYLDNEPYMNIAGSMGVDIPLTSTNRIQAEMRAASSAISAVVGAGAHIMAGDVVGGAAQAATGALNIAGMDFNSQRTSSHSPACTSTENRAVFLEIFRPAIDPNLFKAGYKSRHGWPCHKFTKLSSLQISGKHAFVKCDARTKIDFAMTQRENEMLEQLLTSGVYV